MRVLVTGAAGFIGAALSEHLLARGDAVIGIDNCNDYYDPALKAARIERVQSAGGDFAFYEIDFADIGALTAALNGQNFDSIVHLGAQAGVRYSLENPAAYVQSNLVGHANMLEVARQRGVAHMVYASSSSVYGGNDKLPFSVDDRADHPVSLYAATKRADEMLSESYAHLFRIPLTGLRFFTVYGPWGRPDMAMWIFTQKILAGQPIPVFNKGEMWRDFTYIDDIIAGVVAALDHPPADDGNVKAGGSSKPHALYNIGNHRSEKLMRVIELLGDACGREVAIDWQPMQAGDVTRTYADIDAIQRDLGYAPTTSIDVGVPRFVEWYRGYHS
ncbi:MAG: GDP-mannose 4,6-dehydratase [Erythrobacter sp.]|nr:MAG: GDP-mannose 4,6-dehydratase [Erythrobacter sp.]